MRRRKSKRRKFVKPPYFTQFSVMLILGVMLMFVSLVYLYASIVPVEIPSTTQTSTIGPGEAAGAPEQLTSMEVSPTYKLLVDLFLQWYWGLVFMAGFLLFVAALVIEYDLPLLRRSTWQRKRKK